jgi:hypothetical protein
MVSPRARGADGGGGVKPGAERDIAPEPQHGDRATCSTCGGRIHYLEYTAWNGLETDVLDAWWAHDMHPADGHDAKPGVTL